MKLLTLEEWSKRIYSDTPPTLPTLQRWARNGNIYPPPEKHGKQYRVREDAIYINPRTFALSNHKPLIDRIMNESPISGSKKR
ncbi:excisionase [Cedecea sp.]|jgi:hypothetical protein|uniref:excisionase n=1 Tax=Cedecea sp. TaxID=1970739 RepID=UPI002F422EF5